MHCISCNSHSSLPQFRLKQIPWRCVLEELSILACGNAEPDIIMHTNANKNVNSLQMLNDTTKRNLNSTSQPNAYIFFNATRMQTQFKSKRAPKMRPMDAVCQYLVSYALW